ncbi:MAG: response regulator [Spirochaetota bacterium]
MLVSNGGRMRILVAEDERINQLYMKHLLAGAGHEVVLASTGAEAIEMLREQPCDIVLMDVQMPEMDGIEASRRVRAGEAGEAVARVPIVALTAFATSDEPHEYAAAGVNRSVTKPLEERRLFALLEELAGETEDLG